MTRFEPIKPDPPVTMIFCIIFKDLYILCVKLVKELSFKIKYYYIMKLNDLSIVIVTFRSEEKIINCLNSIPENIKVIIVENSNNKSFKEN